MFVSFECAASLLLTERLGNLHFPIYSMQHAQPQAMVVDFIAVRPLALRESAENTRQKA